MSPRERSSYFNEIFDHLLEWEGGYVNDPNDPGGETKFGISKNAYPELDIKELTKEKAKKIYYRDYWEGSHAHELQKGLDLLHFDTAVNMGVDKAVRLLQRAGGTTEDGIFGPKTKEAAENVDIGDLALQRALEYMAIVGDDESLAKYAGGWKNRLSDTYKKAQDLCRT